MIVTKAILLSAAVAQVYAATITSSGYAPQFSPVFPSDMTKPTGVVTSYNPGPYDTSSTLSTTKLKGYPATWESPPTNSAEVKKVYNMIDWSKVPKAPVRKQDEDGNWLTSNPDSDPYCWWSYTNCVKPKASYLPEDIYTCNNKGDWGLTYDDGPFNRYDPDEEDAAKENKYAEPALYNFLVNTNQKASLFYIGSNVVNYPAAAKRGLNDGHHLCSHTWSHPPMTTQTNAQVVAELYWSLKAIKEATGVTAKCWRPPQGDVDDRVRAIAWQMGLTTVLWDRDTNDWDMPAPGGGNLSPKKVDGYFRSWINDYKSGKDTDGHIVLEHELNSATVNMSMFWMPKIQSVFNVVPALACNGISQPYWEENFVYPLTHTPPTGTTTTKTTATSTATPTSTTCAAGSFGLGKGDGYNGACCKDQSDCWDDCIKGVCNGPVNTKTTTSTKTTTKTTSTTTSSPTSTATCTAGSYGLGKGDGYNGACCKDQSDCWDDCIKGVCNGPVNTKTITSTKTTTKATSTTKTASPTSTATCTAGSYGLGKGDGYNGACCKDQSDCWDDCIKGTCNGPVNTKTTTKKSTTTKKTTTKKTTTKKTTTKKTTTTKTASCKSGSKGKKLGNGKTGYCCTSSDDCVETCRNGVCGL